ncbi:hypothetical protein [Wenyingzhuangia sp. IMCC45467]
MKNRKEAIVTFRVISFLSLIIPLQSYSYNELKKFNENAELKISIFHKETDSLKKSSEYLNELIKDFDNLYALNHIELYTKKIHKRKPQTGLILPLPPVSHRSLNIIETDSLWLKEITRIIKKKPKLLLQYINNENYNLSSYILFIEIFNIDMIQVADKLSSPTFYMNVLKKDILNSDQYKKMRYYEEVPKNTNPQKYILNKIWKENAEKEAEIIMRDYIKKL